MQNDDMVWQVISKNFCSFKVKTLRDDMCRNEYNVSGKCNRVSCPLANSNYGTVVESSGRLFLCLKTVERAHLPRAMWERITLPLAVHRAKEVIENAMRNFYKGHQIERCKRRAAKLCNMLDRMRRMELKLRERLIPRKKKTERREAVREKKAEVAAHLDDVIEGELLKRLQQGVYGRLYDAETSTKMEGATAREDFPPRTRMQTGRGRTQYDTEAPVEEELLESEGAAAGEGAVSREDAALRSVASPVDDVEDLTVSWAHAVTAENSCASFQEKKGPTQHDSSVERDRRHWAAYSSQKHTSAAQKRARFFCLERVLSFQGSIPIAYEDEAERVHTQYQ